MIPDYDSRKAAEMRLAEYDQFADRCWRMWNVICEFVSYAWRRSFDDEKWEKMQCGRKDSSVMNEIFGKERVEVRVQYDNQ